MATLALLMKKFKIQFSQIIDWENAAGFKERVMDSSAYWVTKRSLVLESLLTAARANGKDHLRDKAAYFAAIDDPISKKLAALLDD